jgi:hypothetical protein
VVLAASVDGMVCGSDSSTQEGSCGCVQSWMWVGRLSEDLASVRVSRWHRAAAELLASSQLGSCNIPDSATAHS